MQFLLIPPVFDISISTGFDDHLFCRIPEGYHQRQLLVLFELEYIGKLRGKGSNPATPDAFFHGSEQQVLGGDAKVELGLFVTAFQPVTVQEAEDIGAGPLSRLGTLPIGKISCPAEIGKYLFAIDRVCNDGVLPGLTVSR